MTSDTREHVIAACSFCGKPGIDVVALVAGPGVYICSECVTLCQQVIDAKADKFPRLAPWQQIDDVEAVLQNLPRIAKAGVQLEASLTGWVRRGRELGATWARIGDALGMTRQSAWARFSGAEQNRTRNRRRPGGAGYRKGAGPELGAAGSS